MAPLAIGTGGIVVALVVILIALALAYGLFTRAGSGVCAHPHRDQRAPGGEDAVEEEVGDEPVSPTLDQRGTR